MSGRVRLGLEHLLADVDEYGVDAAGRAVLLHAPVEYVDLMVGLARDQERERQLVLCVGQTDGVGARGARHTRVQRVDVHAHVAEASQIDLIGDEVAAFVHKQRLDAEDEADGEALERVRLLDQRRVHLLPQEEVVGHLGVVHGAREAQVGHELAHNGARMHERIAHLRHRLEHLHARFDDAVRRHEHAQHAFIYFMHTKVRQRQQRKASTIKIDLLLLLTYNRIK